MFFSHEFNICGLTSRHRADSWLFGIVIGVDLEHHATTPTLAVEQVDVVFVLDLSAAMRAGVELAIETLRIERSESAITKSSREC